MERLHEAPELRCVLEGAERPQGPENRAGRPADSERRGLVRCRRLLRPDEHLLRAREGPPAKPEHSRGGAVAPRRLEQHAWRSARQHQVRLGDESLLPDRGAVPVLPVSPQGPVRQVACRGDRVRDGRERVAHVRDVAAEERWPAKALFPREREAVVRAAASSRGSMPTCTTRTSRCLSARRRARRKVTSG